jgi:hypothetical protein
LATLLWTTNRLAEAEPLMRRALAILEQSYGKEHPDVATGLNNLAQLLETTDRPTEAEPMYRRGLAILVNFQQKTGHEHPGFRTGVANYVSFLKALGKTHKQIERHLRSLIDDLHAAGA